MNDTNSETSPTEQLRALFGNYKAEWLREALFDLFTEPAYFPDLRDPRPCVLEGGRGTGKTTVLRCLSYEGRFVLADRQSNAISVWPYYGLYYRVNTNRVTAFRGPELPPEQWVRLFAHYFNLELCELVIRFLLWYGSHGPVKVQLGEDACGDVAISLHLPQCVSVEELARSISRARIGFEAYINNVADSPPPPLSLQGAPIDALLSALKGLPEFANKSFYFLLDEYENFEDYQQQVVNTLVKHASEFYTFKIGVRELGWRRRTTLNENEQLISPADYVRINITERLGNRFSDFAKAVCNDRLHRVSEQGRVIQDVDKILPGITEEEEAERLGARTWARTILNKVDSSLTPGEQTVLGELTPLQIIFLQVWSDEQRVPFSSAVRESLANPKKWQERYENYRHSLLFVVNRGKRGIRKYYAGWDVFTKLSAGNIRYLLELVDTSMSLHSQDGLSLGDPISPEIQTRAAQAVGKKNLSELEGLSVHGAKLTKLLLGLGRIFGVMAAQPIGHTPEVNQFALKDSAPTLLSEQHPSDEGQDLLRAAVMHLALVRFPGTKLPDTSETKDYDYTVHPVFAPYFEFSHRRKRKMLLSIEDVLGLVRDPRLTIERILREQNRTVEEPLPDQLRLFEGFYAGGL